VCLPSILLVQLWAVTWVHYPQAIWWSQAMVSMFFSLHFLVPSIAVKESASLVCSVIIMKMIKEVYSSSPLALFAG